MDGLLFTIHWVWTHLTALFYSAPALRPYRRKSVEPETSVFYRNKKTPQWVIDQVLKLKVHLPDESCRTIAFTFNRLFAHRNMSVGKTFVNEVTKKHLYEIQVLQKKYQK